MSVFVIADIKVTDDGWVPEYATHVHNLVAKHGGKYHSRSGNIEVLEGAPKDSTLVAIIEFPDRDAVMAFASDPDYAPFGQARQAGSVSQLYMIDDTDLAGTIPNLTAA